MDVRAAALEIVKTLNREGYTAFFAGGWVRDLIMDHASYDIDIATDAPPEVIMDLFPHTIALGLAFGIVLVIIQGHQFEVATFRKDIEYLDGRRPEKIELSTAQEDACRRDFTINGMFYDPIEERIHDFVQGIEDLKKGVVKTIGNPHERFVEDRLRMIRAVRFASRFDFFIEEETRQAIQANAHTLFPAVAMERVWQEFQKMARYPRFDRAIIEMHRLGLLPVIFPALEDQELKEIEKRVAYFNQFPKGSPVVLFLLELFPDMQLEELLEMCQYLKTSGHEGKLLEFAYKGRQLLKQDEIEPGQIEESQWANFYAHRLFQPCFDALTAGYPEKQRESLIEHHQMRRERLLPHIQRLAERRPLVTAAVLLDCGILPGKQMGLLLREAESIAIKHDLHDPSEVITKLKGTDLWPK